MSKDLYFVLQVAREATPEQIHSAYRRRALDLHPERTGPVSGPFIELQEAYSVLSDPAQRAAYDRSSMAIQPSQHIRPSRPRDEPFRDVAQAEIHPAISLIGSFESFAPSFDELFDRLWGNFELGTRPKAEVLESLTVDVPLSHAEAQSGGTVRVLVPALLTCSTCAGEGSVGLYECWRCKGAGTQLAEYPLELSFPAGLSTDHMVRLALDDFGIHNFYLTVRFRPTSSV